MRILRIFLRKRKQRLRSERGRMVVASACGTAVLTAAVLLSLLTGSQSVRTGDILAILRGNGTAAARLIFFGVRLPRTAAALLCGSSLSCAGVLLQAALRNPLCSPGVMGVNAGAGLFALLAGLLAPGSVLLRGEMAFLGALASVALVYGVCRGAGVSRGAIVLAGVAVSSLMSAGVNVIITLWPEAAADRAAFSLGGLDGIPIGQMVFSAVLIAVSLAGAWLLAGGIDLLALGDEAAAGLGLPVARVRVRAILCATVLAASAVSMCGLLGFLGLIVPNVVRMAAGGSCREQLFLSAIWGGGFLCVCDTAARTVAYPYQLPVGLLLSLLGAPFFIFLLTRRKRGGTG